MKCNKCNNDISETVNFCGKCGAKIERQKITDSYNKIANTASQEKRFINFLLDSIIIFTVFSYIIIFIVSTVNSLIGFDRISLQDIEEKNSYYLLIFILYYFMFEVMWQRTPGKWITGTKVVTKDGNEPGNMQILGRTFTRLIPFEIFSYLFKKNAIGWHDSLSNTLVVLENKSVDSLQKKINDKDSNNGMNTFISKSIQWSKLRDMSGTKIFLIASALLIVIGLFYWTQIRPIHIKSTCAEYAMKKGNIRTYESFYKPCLNKHGL